MCFGGTAEGLILKNIKDYYKGEIMKKRVGVFVLCALVGGCYSDTLTEFRNNNRKNLTKLAIGMTKQEVMEIMGHETGEKTFTNLVGKRTFLSATNPYRIEILQGKEKTFEVLHYYTDVKKDDNAITDDELTPMVFDNGRLIGWGSSFLEQNIQKYEIRFR